MHYHGAMKELPSSSADPAVQVPISAWRGEFTVPDAEQTYRRSVQVSMAQQLRGVLAIWGVAMLVFALPDYAQLGATRAFWQLTAYRVVMAALMAYAFVRLRQRPELAPGGRVVMWLGLVCYPFFFLFYFLRPEMRTLNTGMIMLLQLSLFVFPPGRALAYVPVALLGVVGATAAVWALGVTGAMLMGVVFVVTLPAIVGYASAVRLQRAQRLEYQVRHQLMAANQGLQAEMQRRIDLEQQLLHQASTDPLTGLPNRRAFELHAHREIARARRSSQPLSVALLDIDHFKQINDGFGHAGGDEVLRTVGSLGAHCFRCEDCMARIGGEEFAVLLPGTPLEQAGDVMQRFLDQLAGTVMKVGTPPITVTATVGVAQYGPQTATLEQLLSQADAAMYAGKREGRDCVVLSLAPGRFQRRRRGEGAPAAGRRP